MLLELRLKRIRIQQQKKLNESNFYLYESITSYIQNSNLSGIEKEEILQEVIDMMLEAEIENKSINLIIGNDYEEFCSSIVREYTRSKSKTYIILNYAQGYLFWSSLILVFMVNLNAITNGFSFKSGLTLDQIIVASFISLIIIPNSKKNRREIISITPWHQRLSIMNRGVLHFGILIVLLRRLIYQLFPDPDIFKSNISINIIIRYLILMIILVIGAEIYKRKYDKAN